MAEEDYKEQCELLAAEVEVLKKENLSSVRKIKELEKEIGRLTSMFLRMKIAK